MAENCKPPQEPNGELRSRFDFLDSGEQIALFEMAKKFGLSNVMAMLVKPAISRTDRVVSSVELLHFAKNSDEMSVNPALKIIKQLLPDVTTFMGYPINEPTGSSRLDIDANVCNIPLSQPSTGCQCTKKEPQRPKKRIRRPQSNDIRLYLSHPFAHRDVVYNDFQPELQTHLDQFSEVCGHKQGFTLVNPFYHVKRNDMQYASDGSEVWRDPEAYSLKESDQVVYDDLDLIDSCDGVIGYVPAEKRMFGTPMEMFYAARAGKSVFIYLPVGAMSNRTHFWLRHVCHDKFAHAISMMAELLIDYFLEHGRITHGNS